MKQIASYLLFIALGTSAAQATPAYFIDSGMVIRPQQLLGRAVGQTGLSPRLTRVSAVVRTTSTPAAPATAADEPYVAALLPVGAAFLLWVRRRRTRQAG